MLAKVHHVGAKLEPAINPPQGKIGCLRVKVEYWNRKSRFGMEEKGRESNGVTAHIRLPMIHDSPATAALKWRIQSKS